MMEVSDTDKSLSSIGAVVLAAGLSTRMGKPKMILPWKGTTVIGKVISTLLKSGVHPIIAVTGGANTEVEQALGHLPVVTVFNPKYANGEMLDSLQLGIKNLEKSVGAALIVLGDQPSLEEQVVRDVITLYQREKAKLVVPSYRMRRGHPWLVDSSLWPQILALKPPQTLRDFMQAHAETICYQNVDTNSILQDIDTPEDYAQQQPPESDH
jgi:molybdenum cofactor cytidylyltransferase